jgi:penicillin amidase
MRILMVVAAVAVGLATLLLVARAWLLWRHAPRAPQDATVSGIDADVTLRFDRRGVVHVDAGSMADAAFAMGWAHVRERMWQMELARRVASGRVSEMAGSDGIAADRFLRRVGLWRVVREEAAALEGDARVMLEAYCAGVNAGATTLRRRPIEMVLLGLQWQPWTPEDSLGVAKILDLALALNWDIEAQRLALLRAVGPEKAAAAELLYPGQNPTILGEARAASGGGADISRLFEEAARWMPVAGGASNSWVISGKHTASGRPLLCNDPHLTPSVPSPWFQAHIRAGDDFECAGVTIPGLPFAVIGHNSRVAWGFTNSFADVQDLVIEDFEDPGGRRYRTEDGWAPTQVIREVIRVKGGEDVVEEVLVTRHGPVVEDLEKVGDSWRGLALQWTSHRPGTVAEALLAMQRAGNWEQFKAAHRLFSGPSLNAVYADVDGHIGYLLTGRLPLRAADPSGVPQPGWTGAARWIGEVPAEQMPAVLDPERGMVVTANNRVSLEADPYIGSDFMNGYRAARIEQLLADRPANGFEPEQMKAFQMDVRSLPALEAVALLEPLEMEGSAERIRRRLVSWDGEMSPKRVEPGMYEAFAAALARRALEPHMGEGWTVLAGHATHPVFDYPGNIIGRLVPDLLRRWREGDTALLMGRAWADVAAEALEDVAGQFPLWRRPLRSWGRVHRLTLRHNLSQSVPALGPLLDVGTIRIGGSGDTVMATCHSPTKPYRTSLWAPSWRQVLDVGDWDNSTGIHQPGQSGHPGSANFRDMLSDWRRGRQRRMSWTEAAVEEDCKRKVTLRRETPA